MRAINGAGHGGWGSAEVIGGWYDSNWHYRKCHIIEPNEGAGTNYQVRINAHYLNGTDSGADVYFGGKCKGGFGDIRFTGMDGVSSINYLDENKCSGNAAFLCNKAVNYRIIRMFFRLK